MQSSCVKHCDPRKARAPAQTFFSLQKNVPWMLSNFWQSASLLQVTEQTLKWAPSVSTQSPNRQSSRDRQRRPISPGRQTAGEALL